MTYDRRNAAWKPDPVVPELKPAVQKAIDAAIQERAALQNILNAVKNFADVHDSLQDDWKSAGKDIQSKMPREWFEDHIASLAQDALAWGLRYPPELRADGLITETSAKLREVDVIIRSLRAILP
jgi:hypothetical protein